MNAINLVHLTELDSLPQAQRVARMSVIANLIGTATPDELRGFEIVLVPYKGDHKNDLKEMVSLQKASFPQHRYQQHKIGKPFQNNSKSFINPKKTNTHENILSFWRFLRFWHSSQQGQQSTKIQNKQCQISQKKLQMQSTIQHQKQQILLEKNQHQPAKKLLHSIYRPEEAILDGLLQEQQQSLLSGAMVSVDSVDIVRSRAKQEKTWKDQTIFSSKLKES